MKPFNWSEPQHHCLRECELHSALVQSQTDVAASRFVTESAQQHMERLDALLAVKNASPVTKKQERKAAYEEGHIPKS